MNTQRGFTHPELVIIIAIVGILVASISIALDPSARYQRARDAVRQADVQNIFLAIKEDQTKNDNLSLESIGAMTPGEVYMIVSGAIKTGCAQVNDVCITNVSSDAHCVDLSGLVGSTLSDLPVSPDGSAMWDSGSIEGELGTGYTLELDEAGVIHVRACESDGPTEIQSKQ